MRYWYFYKISATLDIVEQLIVISTSNIIQIDFTSSLGYYVLLSPIVYTCKAICPYLPNRYHDTRDNEKITINKKIKLGRNKKKIEKLIQNKQ